MRTFDALAALLALVMLARHGRRALGVLAPRGEGTAAGRLAAMAPLLTCLAAAAVLFVAAKGLLLGHPTPGAIP